MTRRTPDIGPAAVRYTCQAPKGTGPDAEKRCGGPCGDAEPGLTFRGAVTFLPEPDGRTRSMRCARCNRWNLYRAADQQAA